MLLSYRHKFILVHVPKAAGSSMTRALRPYAHQPDRYLANRLLDAVGIHVNHFGPHRWRRFRQHETALTVKNHLPAAVYDPFFKFAFVRNPWDWLVSSYHYILRKRQHARHDKVRTLGTLGRYVLYEARRNKLDQASLITDCSDLILVDFVGRYEQLEKHYKLVCDRIGIQSTLPWVTRSERGDYRNYYDDASAELVALHWQRDIELFGYRFDGIAADGAEIPWLSQREQASFGGRLSGGLNQATNAA